MPSNTILVGSIVSCLAFLINGTVLFLVLSRGRQRYHYLFAASLAAFAISNLSIELFYIRNSHPGEAIIYFSVTQSCALLSVPCIYHFTCRYLDRPGKKSTIIIWAYMAIATIFTFFGVVSGTGPMALTHADWGNYMAFHGGVMDRIFHSVLVVSLLVII